MLAPPAAAQGKCFDVLPTHLQLIRDCGQLLYCSSFRDVTFLCSDGTVQANRAFLAARSDYFRGLLFGGLQESFLAHVELPQVKAGPLRLVLHYLHTLEIRSTDVEEMMDACELARQYDVPDCESCLLQRLQDQILLSGAAISIVLDKAASLAMPQLELLALERCSSMVITPVAFQGFSPYALNLCLSAAHLKASEASIFEAVINWGKQQLSNNPVLSMPDVLADIMPKVQLDSIPADVLLGLMTSLHLTPAEATSLQGAQQPQAQPCLSKQYARRPWGELGKDIACTDIDTIQFACQQHQGARSRHCLKSGTGRYVWHLCIERYSSCTWIGLVDDTADMTRWLGCQKNCYMMGSNGSIAAAAAKCNCNAAHFGCSLSPTEKVLYDDQSYHVTPYGAKFERDGTRVTVHIDMDARRCSFEVDGINYGVAFWTLPAQVYPAVSMRYGGKVKFITCMAVD